MKLERINFLEREPIALSYRKMVWIGVVLVGVGGLFYGVQTLRGFSAAKKEAQLTAEVGKLKQEQERLLRELQGGAQDATARGILIQIFDDPLSWSTLMRELTLQIPNSLWLNSVKSYAKPDVSSERGVVLDGQAGRAEAVTQFVRSISDSPFFEKVILTSLEQGKKSPGENYQFSIDLVLTSLTKKAKPIPPPEPAKDQKKEGGKGA